MQKPDVPRVARFTEVKAIYAAILRLIPRSVGRQLGVDACAPCQG